MFAMHPHPQAAIWLHTSIGFIKTFSHATMAHLSECNSEQQQRQPPPTATTNSLTNSLTSASPGF